MLQPKYIVAVSGGVDSIVLLNMITLSKDISEQSTSISLPQDITDPKTQIIVAHLDHGIREDSASDEEFVKRVAGRYGVAFESQRVELGVGISEDKARQVRYNFLRQCCKKYNAQLITAHHQDDVLETMIINLIRGTGWRGLAPMVQIPNHKSQIINNIQILSIKPETTELSGRHPGRDVGSSNNKSNNCILNPRKILHGARQVQDDGEIVRPLLNVPKSQILEYAKKYNLKWREDSTNTNQDYLRNYVRLTLLPKMYKVNPESRNELLKINSKITEVKTEIATELQNSTIKYQLSNIDFQLPRYDLIMYPPIVTREIIHYVLTHLDSDWHPNNLQVTRVLHFIKTGQNGKIIEVSKHLKVELNKGVVQFKKH